MSDRIKEVALSEYSKAAFLAVISQGCAQGSEESVAALWRLARLEGPVEVAAFDAGKNADERTRLTGPCVAYGTIEQVLAPDGLLNTGRSLFASGLYVTPARIQKDVLHHYDHGKWQSAKDGTASEADVEEPLLLVLDIDVAPVKDGRPQKRKSNTSKQQWRTAMGIGWKLREWLISVGCGESALGFASSGNGCHVVLAVAGEANAELKTLRERLLLAVAKLWDTDKGDATYRVDQSMADFGRFVPLFGSTKAKAANHPDSPWRITWLVAPDVVQPLDEGALRTLVEAVEGSITADVEAEWARRREREGLPVAKPKSHEPSTLKTRKGRSDGAGAWERYREAIDAIPIQDVATHFGIDLTKCPNCGATQGVKLMDETLKCHHQTQGCGTHKGGNFNGVDLVRLQQHGGLDYTHAEAQRAARDAVASAFGIEKPCGRPPAEPEYLSDEDLRLRAWGGSDFESEYCSEVDDAEVEAVLRGDDLPVGALGNTGCGSEQRAHTDLGNAYRVIDQNGEDLLRVRKGEKASWYRWLGTLWAQTQDDEVLALVASTMEGIYLEAEGLESARRAAVTQWAKKSQSRSSIRAAEDLARALASRIDYEQLDPDGWLLGCRNGVLNLRTGEFGKACRGDRITRHVACDYDPDATCPDFDRTLEWAQPDADVRAYLFRKFGYALTGVVREHNFDIHYGTGGNAKGTVLHTIRKMMGGYGLRLPSDALMANKNDKHPAALRDLPGSRYVLASEVNEGAIWDESLIKQMSGGDGLKTRGMGENYSDSEQTWHTDVMVNTKPRLNTVDRAIQRRINLIPWSQSIADEDIDTELPSKLEAEFSGILNRCLHGCRDWQKQGLSPPVRVQAASREYLDENDAPAQFTAECCDASDPNATTPFKDLLESYTEWAKGRNEKPLGAKRFGNELRRLGFEADVEGKSNTAVRRGLTLLPDAPRRPRFGVDRLTVSREVESEYTEETEEDLEAWSAGI